jgi:hypothetical protein
MKPLKKEKPMNKSMTTLGKVSARVDALSKNCHDKMISVHEISFDSLETMKVSNEPHLLRSMAQQSIAWRLGIPINYLRKCPPEVQAYNMNHWIKKEKNEELFFRFDGEEVRAIFTPRYRPVDCFEVLNFKIFSLFSPSREDKLACCLKDPFSLMRIRVNQEYLYLNTCIREERLSMIRALLDAIDRAIRGAK